MVNATSGKGKDVLDTIVLFGLSEDEGPQLAQKCASNWNLLPSLMMGH